ncbi:membrane protein [Flexivirga endophytica]|uniref:Membrane protein n=1 Tax=Flexivirga endophytica TaxID=1849103 RepID=A0A916SWQ6_9MICO|nr:DUF456 domain-containing protein [Flexivirga endophytica]GGB20755.1 membrane protein [Flexivirga endophytica]GHB58595.1 membrane protein [Flexivirga endophytica]
MDAVTVVAGAMITVGILGLIVPVLPGLLLCLAGVLLWAWDVDSALSWTIFGCCVAVAAIGWVVQFLVPNRRLKAAGVPGWAKLAGLSGAVVGFFVIPYVGMFIGFPAGVFLAEQLRLRDAHRAWAATKAAVRAVLTSIGIELAAAVLVSWIWVAGVVLN